MLNCIQAVTQGNNSTASHWPPGAGFGNGGSLAWLPLFIQLKRVCHPIARSLVIITSKKITPLISCLHTCLLAVYLSLSLLFADIFMHPLLQRLWCFNFIINFIFVGHESQRCCGFCQLSPPGYFLCTVAPLGRFYFFLEVVKI